MKGFSPFIRTILHRIKIHGYIAVLGSYCFITYQASAQESLGSSLDNFAPVNGMLMNPSAIVGQRTWLDIHLLGLGGFVMNNSGYLNNSRLLDLSTLRGVSYNLKPSHTWAQIDSDFLGPSFSISKGKYSLGVHTSLRVVANAKKVPLPYAQMYMNENLQPDAKPMYQLNNARIKTLSWMEIGATYGRILDQFDRKLLSGGITINRLYGLFANSFFVDEGTIAVTGQKLEVGKGSGKYGYVVPSFTTGAGWSGSIGITYKKMIDDVTHYVPHSRKVMCETLPYKWKAMVSLVDIGAIKFITKTITARYEDNFQGKGFLEAAGLEGPTNLDSDATGGDYFYATTPMALNIQYDHNYRRGFFIHAFLLQSVSMPSFLGPERTNILAVTPRYELRYLSIHLPLSLINYTKPQLGIAIRIAGVTLGTENLVPYLVPSDIYGADFYINLRIRFIKSPDCKEKSYAGLARFRFLDIFRRKDNNVESCPEW